MAIIQRSPVLGFWMDIGVTGEAPVLPVFENSGLADERCGR
jgi:hypothetical protein